MKVEFEGMDELIRELERTGQEVDKNKEKALKAGGEVLQKRVKSRAPYRYGILEGNIELSDMKNDQVDVYVDNQGIAYYGYFHEIGTSKMPARPFMGPAFNESQHAIQEAMATSIRKSLGAFL